MTGDDELISKWLRSMERNAAPVMQYPQLSNERGEQYQMSHIFTGTAKDTSRYMMLANPEGNNPAYLSSTLLGAGLAFGYVYENPQLLTSGSLVVPHNTNRTSTKTGTWRAFLDPDPDVFGDVLLAMLIPASQSVAGEVNPDVTWVLDPGLTYLLRVENQAGSEIDLGIRTGWHELET